MKRLFTLLLAGLLCACAMLPTPAERRELADGLARAQAWQARQIATGVFDLVAYVPSKFEPDAQLTVYIEGDGFAWLTPSQPSTDPTPRVPTGLQLALRHPEGNAAYLARPCQFGDAQAQGCAARYWTSDRFATEVVDAENRALDVLKNQFQAKALTLVGYSGGGAVAALMAARRNDVTRLVTVAGNLDHVAWTTEHRVLPLTGSLNPADAWASLSKIPQWHFVGAEDRVVPYSVAKSFQAKFLTGRVPKIITIPGYDHSCCWVDGWRQLWRTLD
jgi:pimeloyl-ACP methyl ester carboxylesterase